MRAYVARKQNTVAILRCLGATGAEVVIIYLIQAGMMGVAGAAIGVAIGSAVQGMLPYLATELIPVDVEVRPDGWSKSSTESTIAARSVTGSCTT